MNVLMMVSWYSPKGEPINGGIFHYEQAIDLKKYCDMAIYYPYDRTLDKEYSDEMEYGIRTFRSAYDFKRKIYNRKNMFSAMKKIVRDFKPDIIHAQVSTEVGRFAIILGAMFHIPVMVTEHSTVEASGITKFPCYWYAKFVFKYSKCNIGVSDELTEKLKEIFPKYTFQTVYNGISMVQSETCIIEKYRVSGHVNIVLVAGLYDRYIKGIPTLLKVIARLHQEGRKIVLHIVGDGEYRKEFEQIAVELGIAKQCIFHGQVSRECVQEIMKNTDFLVSASIMESFGCSIAEAQMQGIPVVATRCGGPESIVIPQSGILVDKGNEEALYKGVLEMLDNYMKYSCEGIRKYAEEKFSLDTISKKYLKIYQSILKEGNNDKMY